MENEKEWDKARLLQALMHTAPAVEQRELAGAAAVDFLSDHRIVYRCGGEKIHCFYSFAETADGTRIDVRAASLEKRARRTVSDALGEGVCVDSLYRQNGLLLRQRVCLYDGGELTAELALSAADGSAVSSRFLAPLAAPYPDADAKGLFLSLDQKMLCVPYDNDMWARYAAVPPNSGVTSYDVTAIFDERTREGLVVGALDFRVWKNAVSWAGSDARSFYAWCGAAGPGTHDSCPHGLRTGTSVSSARFAVFWAEDVRRGMEHYGEMCRRLEPRKKWTQLPVPFGWNSYSALGLGVTPDHWQEAGRFLREEVPQFCGSDGVAYINLDGAFGLDEERLRAVVRELHARGQKAGWYANPCNWFAAAGDMPAKGTALRMKDLFLRDEKGRVLPANDGSVPLDVTLPAWEQYARATIRGLAALGVDYIKLDFLSHGGAEGAHWRADYTGRMALDLAYTILKDEIEKAGREIFVSLSIAPLFPFFFGDARRSCCDSFGHGDDTRYVLNALNFAWWTAGRLYRYTDPDHIPLYASAIDGRGPASEAEAQSRYDASVISGTVMLLSDNYGPAGDAQAIQAARQRARRYANDGEINALARMGQPFVPAALADGLSGAYALCSGGRCYAALFNFADAEQTVSLAAAENGLPVQGVCRDLRQKTARTYARCITAALPAHGSVLLEVTAGT